MSKKSLLIAAVAILVIAIIGITYLLFTEKKANRELVQEFQLDKEDLENEYSRFVQEYDELKFKLYYPDTGLLIASLDEEAQEDLRANKNMGVYKGALYENFVAEAFLKQGLRLYYYKKENATLEEDFFVRTKDELVPVEVKANKNRSKSLRKLIDNESYSDIKWGIKLADSNVGIENGIYTFPYFCSFLIKRYLAKKVKVKRLPHCSKCFDNVAAVY